MAAQRCSYAQIPDRRPAEKFMQIGGKTLAERIGFARFFRDLRYNRHRTRQLVGISFLVLLAVVGMPTNAGLYFRCWLKS
jgi:hypothetical protein